VLSFVVREQLALVELLYKRGRRLSVRFFTGTLDKAGRPSGGVG
jgi:hypothetical protein